MNLFPSSRQGSSFRVYGRWALRQKVNRRARVAPIKGIRPCLVSRCILVGMLVTPYAWRFCVAVVLAAALMIGPAVPSAIASKTTIDLSQASSDAALSGSSGVINVGNTAVTQADSPPHAGRDDHRANPGANETPLPCLPMHFAQPYPWLTMGTNEYTFPLFASSHLPVGDAF
jgi:hypothetical protein